MQAAGNLIAASAELSACMQHRERDLKGAFVQLGVFVHGDAAAVVGHGEGIVLVDVDFNVVAIAAHGFVDGIVHQLFYKMVQSAHIRGTDVHARAALDSLQALQDLNLRSVVIVMVAHSHILSPSRTGRKRFFVNRWVSSACLRCLSRGLIRSRRRRAPLRASAAFPPRWGRTKR